MALRSLKEMMDLRGRVALVTGGGGHIGGTICDSLAELGASVAVLDMDHDSCAATARRVSEDHGVGAMSLVADLADEGAVRSVPGQVLGKLGRLDILVNCAAMVGSSDLKGWAVPFPEQGSEAWRSAMEVNLTAPFVLVQECAKALASSGHGSVINMGSIYGVLGPNLGLYEGTSMANPGAYAASKGGLIQLTRWLATVMAPRVRVNSISPGGVWRDQPGSFHRRYVANTPLGRMATEEDIKGAAAYLASDLSAYVTGHNLAVDGGWTAW